MASLQRHSQMLSKDPHPAYTHSSKHHDLVTSLSIFTLKLKICLDFCGRKRENRWSEVCGNSNVWVETQFFTLNSQLTHPTNEGALKFTNLLSFQKRLFHKSHTNAQDHSYLLHLYMKVAQTQGSVHVPELQLLNLTEEDEDEIKTTTW